MKIISDKKKKSLDKRNSGSEDFERKEVSTFPCFNLWLSNLKLASKIAAASPARATAKCCGTRFHQTASDSQPMICSLEEFILN